MEAITKKEALRKKGASGMGLNMVDSEDSTARHMLARIAAAVHKAWPAIDASKAGCDEKMNVENVQIRASLSAFAASSGETGLM